MKMTIDGKEVKVKWEDNESVSALEKLAPLNIQMSMYGDFEQVGAIGETLPSNDTQITTFYGDIVLFASDQLVVFYGSNSWAYTRLGHITDLDQNELKKLLGDHNVNISITAEQ